jgi:hypothetical protein
LLDGVLDEQHASGDPLAGVLAAAAAPPRAAEQAGEDAAVTVFLTEHLVPVSQSRRGQMIKSPLAKLLTMKVGAVALAFSAGGVALAASTGAFTPAHQASALPSTISSAPVAAGPKQARTHVSASASARGTHVSASAGSTPAAGKVPVIKPRTVLSALDASQACHALAGVVNQAINHANVRADQVLSQSAVQTALDSPALRTALNSPQFASLVATVEGDSNVADYCGLLLHVAKLPAPTSVAAIPASVLSAIPGSVVSQIPGSAVSGVPAGELAQLPVPFLSRLAEPVLAGLPASVLAKLPTGMLDQVVQSLPASLRSTLPGSILSKLTSVAGQRG